MVTWHLTMKLFPAKCHERATLRKLWRQTGNSSLLPGQQFTVDRCCTHVMAGISARFSNLAFVLFCYITNHLMTGPLGNSEFCFPRISMFPETGSRETNSSDHVKQRSTLAGNSELFPVWRLSFRNVARSWHLAGNSFIVRCHVAMT